MKRGFQYGLIGVAVLVAAAIAAPFLLPADIYKEPIERAVGHATGHAFSINGPLHFTLFPVLAIQADQVSLANDPGGHSAPLATAKDVRLNVRLWPLLSRHLEVAAMTLDEPVVNLEVSADGKPNWTLVRTQNGGRGKTGSQIAFTASFSDIAIAHARINYSNLRTGGAYSFEDVDATLNLAGQDGQTTAKGALRFFGKRVDFQMRAADLAQLMHNRQSRVAISAISDLLRANFSGIAAPDGSLDGDVELDTPSAREAAAWMHIQLPENRGFGPLKLKAHLMAADHGIALNSLAFSLDGMRATGTLRVGTREKTPLFAGNLQIDRLDLNPYIEHPHRPGSPHKTRDGETWSSEPLTLDILRKADADLSLDAGSLTVRNLSLGRTKMKVSLNGARLHTGISTALYRGEGTASLEIDARNPIPVFHNVLDFQAVDVNPFLSDAIGVKQIEGTGNIRLDLASAGESASAIMHGIKGNGAIAFQNGRLRGVDLGAVARTIQSFLGAAINPGSFTSFSTMSGSFVAANGVLTSNDFHLTGPVLDTTGNGTVDVGNRTIDFRIVPKATAVIAKQKLSLGVPFHIRGPWKHVHYNADISGIVNGVLDNLKSGNAPFKGLFGPSQPKDPNAPKKKHKNIGDALKNMLGIH